MHARVYWLLLTWQHARRTRRLYRAREAEGKTALAHDALKLLWLPLAPLYALLCAHVERSVRDTAATVRAPGVAVVCAVLRAGRGARHELTRARWLHAQVATLREMQYRYKAL